MTISHEVYISLGASIGSQQEKEQYLRNALQQIETLGTDLIVSDFMISQPWGGVAQNQFCNAVCKIKTPLSPESLLDRLQEIELLAGRKRDVHWGDRTLDLDILFYDQTIIKTPRLTIPHPFLHQRDFVIFPLLEISPDFKFFHLTPAKKQMLQNLIDLPMNRNEFLKELKEYGEQENIPNISWNGAGVLEFFLNLKKPKKALEIGCANGFSSIIIAKELEKWGGSLLTTDVSTPSIESAKENFKAVNLENIEVRFGNALETVGPVDAPFDLIFIDGQKSRTHEFFQTFTPFLSKDGIVIVDDTKKFPDKMKSFKNLLKREEENWEFFTIKDGEDDEMIILTPGKNQKK